VVEHPSTRPLGEFNTRRRAGNLSLTLLLLAALLLLVLSWITFGGPDSAPTADGGQAPSVDESHPPQPSAAGEFDGPVAPLMGPQQETVFQGPPDRVYVSSGASAGTVRGRVVAENWVVWPHALELALESQASGEVLQRRGANQEEPNFEFDPVPFGDYRLRLIADDCLDQALLLTLSAQSTDQHLAVPLIPAAKLLGHVQDTLGQGVPGLPVIAVRRPDKPGHRSVPFQGLTEENGDFTLHGLQPGTYDVMAGSQLQPLGTPQVAHLLDQAGEAWVTLEVPPLGSALITIDFKDGDTARERDSALLRVQAVADGAGSGPGLQLSLPLTADGSVRFPALPPGTYSFTAYGGPYRRTMRHGTVAAGVELQLSIPMRSLTESKPR